MINILQITKNSVERLQYSAHNIKYKEYDIKNPMEKLEEADNESTSSDNSDNQFNQILNFKNQFTERSITRMKTTNGNQISSIKLINFSQNTLNYLTIENQKKSSK
jgi:hypothetical protein